MLKSNSFVNHVLILSVFLLFLTIIRCNSSSLAEKTVHLFDPRAVTPINPSSTTPAGNGFAAPPDEEVFDGTPESLGETPPEHFQDPFDSSFDFFDKNYTGKAPELYPCNIRKIPFFVRLYGTQRCGGTLITVRWAVSAAHCMYFNTPAGGNNTVIIQSGFWGDVETFQYRCADKIVLYDNCSITGTNLLYDIALVKADRPFILTRTLSTIFLPKPGYTEGCYGATAIGIGQHFGLKNETQRQWEVQTSFSCVDLTIVDPKVCASVFNATSIICTKERKKPEDECFEDAGGPLICGNVIIGVVTSGRGCGAPKLPPIFTKIESYRNFIEDNVRMKFYDYDRKFGASARRVRSCVCNVLASAGFSLFIFKYLFRL